MDINITQEDLMYYDEIMKAVDTTEGTMNNDKLPASLVKYADRVRPSVMPVSGREDVIRSVRRAFLNPVMSNPILLGPAGSGKTTLVREMARIDAGKVDYFEINMTKMATSEDNTNGNVAIEMAHKFATLVHDVEAYQKETGKSVVLFIDEFHKIPQLSSQTIEELKPILAASGESGVKIIAATTDREYREFIQENEALHQRLKRVKFDPPTNEDVLKILIDQKKKYLPDVKVPMSVLNLVIDYTNQFMPADAQPRKSVNLFGDVIAGYRLDNGKTPVNKALLDQVLAENTGIDANWRVDVASMKEYLSSRVLDQKYAVESIVKRMHISIASLNNPTKPLGSFLFTGSTGTGKTELSKALAKTVFGDDKAMLRLDMTEFSLESSVDYFRTRLTDEIMRTPSTVILLDEIEKANANVIKLLLQVLDDGRLSNRFGNEVPFTSTYIIMTTNVASEIYATVKDYDDSSEENKANGFMGEYLPVILSALRDSGSKFPPELINRIDTIVPFKPLSDETLLAIAQMRLDEFARLVERKHGVEIIYGRDDFENVRVLNYLVLDGTDNSTNGGGGRGIARRIDDEIKSRVSELINLYPTIEQLLIEQVGEAMYDNKDKIKSDAHLDIRPIRSVKQNMKGVA